MCVSFGSVGRSWIILLVLHLFASENSVSLEKYTGITTIEYNMYTTYCCNSVFWSAILEILKKNSTMNKWIWSKRKNSVAHVQFYREQWLAERQISTHSHANTFQTIGHFPVFIFKRKFSHCFGVFVSISLLSEKDQSHLGTHHFDA